MALLTLTNGVAAGVNDSAGIVLILVCLGMPLICGMALAVMAVFDRP